MPQPLSSPRGKGSASHTPNFTVLAEDTDPGRSLDTLTRSGLDSAHDKAQIRNASQPRSRAGFGLHSSDVQNLLLPQAPPARTQTPSTKASAAAGVTLPTQPQTPASTAFALGNTVPKVLSQVKSCLRASLTINEPAIKI